MIPKRLSPGDTIGLLAISHVGTHEGYAPIIDNIRKAGYIPLEGDHLYSNTYGYLATPEERASDFNQMIRNPSVNMILFGGGEGSNEILPFLDYETIKANPKLICSFSDGTTPLNAIWAHTGLEVYYGQDPGIFNTDSVYNLSCFRDWFIKGDVKTHTPQTPWRPLVKGSGTGILVGGYSLNFGMMQRTPYFPYDPKEDYVLLIEDHEQFGGMSYISAMLSHLEQSDILLHTVGLFYGHYSEPVNQLLLDRLTRLGKKFHIPVAQTDDFGHGANRAVFPIGRHVTFTVDDQVLLSYHAE